MRTDTCSITVYCQDASHAAKRCIVSRLSRAYGVAEEPWEVDDWQHDLDHWSEIPARSARSIRTVPRPPLPEHGSGELPAVIPSDKPRAEQGLDDGRFRYRLHCPLCDRTVPVREERLEPVLDTLARAGVTSVSLTALAARLGKH